MTYVNLVQVVLCMTLNHLIGLSPEDVEMEKLYDYCNDVKSLLSFPINNMLGSRHTKCLQVLHLPHTSFHFHFLILYGS